VKQRIVLLGLPASGKGTQAEMIQARYQIPTASPGAILREERRQGTPLGLDAEKTIGLGQLVSDEIVNAVIKNWLSRQESSFVFDGYPRSLGQATALDRMLEERQMPVDVTLLLEVDSRTIGERIDRRMMCATCGRIVSIGWHVPSANSPCPSCGGTLTRRQDDTSETLELRMREYAGKTEPLSNYYRERGLLRSVDAARPPEVVFSSVAEILEGT
jgi:adenylate kinase